MKKLYIIEKHVVAESICDALKKEKSIIPDNVYLDNDWKKSHMPDMSSSEKIGYKIKKK